MLADAAPIGGALAGGAPASSVKPRQARLLLAWVREFIQFGLVGATAYVVDAGLFNLLQYGPLAVLAGHPNTAQLVAATIATGYSWVANQCGPTGAHPRQYHSRSRPLLLRQRVRHRHLQFCLLFTHHILGLASALADNVAVYVVGFALRRRSASSSTTTWSSREVREGVGRLPSGRVESVKETPERYPIARAVHQHDGHHRDTALVFEGGIRNAYTAALVAG